MNDYVESSRPWRNRSPTRRERWTLSGSGRQVDERDERDYEYAHNAVAAGVDSLLPGLPAATVMALRARLPNDPTPLVLRENYAQPGGRYAISGSCFGVCSPTSNSEATRSTDTDPHFRPRVVP